MKVSFEAACVGSVLTAAVSVAATALYFKLENSKSQTVEKDTVKEIKITRFERKFDAKHYDANIIEEEQARTRAFLKADGMDKLRQTTVAIVGCGGVGSWVANMLCRAGVGKLVLIDFDQVSLSSLNRHATATLEDVGTSKVESMKTYLHKICPWVEIDAVNKLWNIDSGPELIKGVDYVVDCIDNIDTKVDLLTYCANNKIKVVSSMGAGAKADPTRIMVGDISTTYEDPLSRTVRIKLRSRGISNGIPVVYSTEKPGSDKAKLLDINDDQLKEGQVGELSVLRDFRVRTLPVLGPLPAMFGLTIATHLLNTIGEYTSVFDPVLGGYNVAGKKRTQLYEGMLSSAVGQMAKLEKQDVPARISVDDVEYLLEEVWRGKTLNGQYTRQKLTLWDPKGPRNIHNMVPITKEGQKVHTERVLLGGEKLSDVYDAETIDLVNRRMGLDAWYQQFRVN